MRSVTITLDEEVARWALIRAAGRETSLSRLVGELLREKMVEDKVCEEAMQQYLCGAAGMMRREGVYTPRVRISISEKGLPSYEHTCVRTRLFRAPKK